MCVEWTEPRWTTTKAPMIAYKAVSRKGRSRISRYLGRSPQKGFDKTVATQLRYPLRRRVESPKPGIYLYQSLGGAQADARFPSTAVVEVRIPAGTLVRRGTGYADRGTINALACYVVREVQP